MARARRVRGIRPGQTLGENARRVVAVRLAELLSWRGALDDPSLVAELHDMRIAAKRLRYALEMFEVCFPEVKKPLKKLTDIQEDLGAIHDLDVLTGMFRERLRALDAATEEEVVEIMGADVPLVAKVAGLRRLVAAQAREPRRQGLLGLIGEKVAERRRLYGRFQERWAGAALDEFAAQVRRITGLDDEGSEPGPLERGESTETPVGAAATGDPAGIGLAHLAPAGEEQSAADERAGQPEEEMAKGRTS
jgi:hypothetical protein